MTALTLLNEKFYALDTIMKPLYPNDDLDNYFDNATGLEVNSSSTTDLLAKRLVQLVLNTRSTSLQEKAVLSAAEKKDFYTDLSRYLQEDVITLGLIQTAVAVYLATLP